MKNSNNPIENRTRNIPACSAVTALQVGGGGVGVEKGAGQASMKNLILTFRSLAKVRIKK